MRDKKINRLVKVAVLSVIAFLLMFLEFAVPIFPSFLKIDISDLPALIGTFALGPVAGISIEFLKNILHGIFAGQTAFVGELANFIVGTVLVVTAGFIYKGRKTKKSAVLGLISGTITMSIAAGLINYFVLLPLYQKAFNFPISQMVAIAGKINGNITDVWTLILLSIVPFNLIKGCVLTVITLLIYKKVSIILKKEDKDGRQAA
ncbi:ECF transporter S component [Clostridium tyrobutyricum]|uniref:ECF transporter S component n=1 Tax=Clostridium tyrobutyricum TaxID=1519 RepID=UPI001C3806BE|nr:ECF transporter S component [Clostridium tyrobutyricum]MBV4448164.1 ECF transporter S component [Clostridium tyrobutyricum]